MKINGQLMKIKYITHNDNSALSLYKYCYICIKHVFNQRQQHNYFQQEVTPSQQTTLVLSWWFTKSNLGCTTFTYSLNQLTEKLMNQSPDRQFSSIWIKYVIFTSYIKRLSNNNKTTPYWQINRKNNDHVTLNVSFD